MRTATGEQAEKHGIGMRGLHRAQRPRQDPEPDLALRAKVASACDSVETAALDRFSHNHVQIFRQMLLDIIGDSEDRGSCL